MRGVCRARSIRTPHGPIDRPTESQADYQNADVIARVLEDGRRSARDTFPGEDAITIEPGSPSFGLLSNVWVDPDELLSMKCR
jgi:hypothetical protein